MGGALTSIGEHSAVNISNKSAEQTEVVFNK
jgi:hypothetical protein